MTPLLCESLEASGTWGDIIRPLPHTESGGSGLNCLEGDLPCTVSTVLEVKKTRLCTSLLVRDETSHKNNLRREVFFLPFVLFKYKTTNNPHR